jgi:hypothetical protein
MSTTTDLSTVTTNAIAQALSTEQALPEGKKPLKTVHYRMMYLEVFGHSVKEIAEALGYTTEGIYLARQTELYQRELAKLRAQIQSEAIQRVVERLNILILPAIEVIESILHDPDAPKALKLRAAQDILNRVPATSITLRQFSNPSGKPEMTEEEWEKAVEHMNNVAATIPGMQCEMLERARQKALDELTRIDEALAQV